MHKKTGDPVSHISQDLIIKSGIFLSVHDQKYDVRIVKKAIFYR